MAAPNQNPLQVLDQMFNEILIQTGKHLKASVKDGPRNVVGASNAIRAKTSDSLTTYHFALDDLESEITRAKAVVLRDLEKLRAARAPPPVPAPPPQPVAPPAPMMEMPSSAAHTMNAPVFVPRPEQTTAAPFPDMGMGMSTDVVDLTSNDKKPSPRVPPGAVRPPVKGSPAIRNEVKPSPKQVTKPTPKPSQPPKVTPVPVPQIPRLQPPQPAALGPAAATQSQQALNTKQHRAAHAMPAAQTAQAAQDATLNAMLMPANAPGGDTNVAGGSNTLGFTDMQFSLAPSNAEPSGAPPAPMPEFDLTAFAPHDGSNDMLSLDNNKPSNSNAGAATTNTAAVPQQQQPKEQDKNDTNLDDLFNLDTDNGGTDMFDLSGGVNTFNDMMYFDDNNNDNDMEQFDEDFFLR